MSNLDDNGSIKNPYENFIALSRYARWMPDKGRRETWGETVDRVVDFFEDDLTNRIKQDVSKEVLDLVRNEIKNQEVMPSMRVAMTAGEALKRNNIAAYNCSFIPVDSTRSFDEALLILMHGTGLGFSVASKHVSKLPSVAETFHSTDTTIVVGDSKEGWAKAYKELINLLWSGQKPLVDVTRVRPAGARLKVFGGRASGPEPLIDLFNHTQRILEGAAGRKITSKEAHSLMCKIADVVVVGGVRRSALISLSDLDDFEMANAKSGAWWEDNGHFALANNSAIYYSKPSIEKFIDEWKSLIESKSGERGIFSLKASQDLANRNGRRDGSKIEGTNPCAEILLRSYEFCNLTEVVVRADDTLDRLKEKVRVATIMGTWQSALTDIKYLRKIWKTNIEEERLLGVSLTGQFGHSVLSGTEGFDKLREWLQALRQVAVDTNKAEAERLGIPQSTAITCVKPSGCRPWDSITITDDGILTMEEIFEKSGHKIDEEWHNTSINTPSGRITKTYNNGIAEVFRINMSYGHELRSTGNHQWFVKGRGWTRTDDIIPGDVIEFEDSLYRKTDESKLLALDELSIHMRTDAFPTKEYPTEMSADLAWLIGYLWGDGAQSPMKYRIRFSDENLFNLEKARSVLLDLFGIDSKIVEARTGTKAASLEVGNKYLWHWLIKNNIWKYYLDDLDIIPVSVRSASQESVIAFFAGMCDSDGWVGSPTNKGKFIITTSSELFARNLIFVGTSIGLNISKSKNVKFGEGKFGSKPMYLMSSNGNTNEQSMKLFVKHSQKARVSEIETWLSQDTAQKSLTIGKVKSVESLGLDKTYDVEIENTHFYYDAGFKSHNTVSQLNGVSSGMHPWHSEYYIRTVRGDKKDPMSQFMRDAGIPNEPDVMNPDNTVVFSFPIAAPAGAIVRSDLTAIQHLELWLEYQRHWCEHKPSVTISVRDEEWMEVGAWVYRHFEEMSGVSFLPHSEHTYKQAPYQEITETDYKQWVASMPKHIDWSQLSLWEFDDEAVNGVQELACAAGACDVTDLISSDTNI